MKKSGQKIHKTDFSTKIAKINNSLLETLKKSNVIENYFYDEDFILINGECIKTMNGLINSGVKVDHIITDIPYGTIQGLSIEGWKNSGTVPTWDSPIDLNAMIPNCFNISKANSNLLLFSQEPMTFKLIEASNMYQKYTLSNKLIWVKNNHANGFAAKTTPVNYYEEVLLFRKKLDESNSIKLRTYFKNILGYLGIERKKIMEELGQGLDHCFRFENRTFYIPTEKNYSALIERYKIDKMPGFIPYIKLKKEWDDENKTVFNLPKNQKIYKNVLEFSKDSKNIHPTQKPLDLLINLLNVFSNEGDTILDFTSGSGSTGIACYKSNRKFLGIELDKGFFEKSVEWFLDTKAKIKI
jgi:DNA modification methylase